VKLYTKALNQKGSVPDVVMDEILDLSNGKQAPFDVLGDDFG